VVRDRDGRPQEDPLVVNCFCVCNGSPLLEDLLRVSRSMERDLLSVDLSYDFLAFIHCVSSLSRVSLCDCILLYIQLFMCVSCFSLVLSTCRVIG